MCISPTDVCWSFLRIPEASVPIPDPDQPDSEAHPSPIVLHQEPPRDPDGWRSPRRKRLYPALLYIQQYLVR